MPTVWFVIVKEVARVMAGSMEAECIWILGTDTINTIPHAAASLMPYPKTIGL
jgi:hypothetical protein